MYKLVISSRFKKDHKNKFLARAIPKLLREAGIDGIPVNMGPHKISANYKDNLEYHLRPDLLIIWFQIERPKTIKLIRIGSYCDLF